MSSNERQLVALAAALINDRRSLSGRERRLIKSKARIARAEIEATRKHIRAGGDPLGDAFCVLRTPEQRRGVGATYTPASIVQAMIAWADEQQTTPTRIVDPGAGSGRFIAAAAVAFPRARLVAVEKDPVATLLLRANATALGFANRLTVMLSDYREIKLPASKGPTLFVGNPPYVRHHQIANKWKTWFAKTAARFDLTASKLAGLHIHFFLKTRELAAPGDFGALITAAEWIDVNYGSVLRRMLADGLGGTALHVIDPKAQPFADALTTAAITCFRVGHRPNNLTLAAVGSLSTLASLSQGRSVSWNDLAAAPKWSPFLRPQVSPAAGTVELGELFRVHRGQVSGKNSVWIESPGAATIPERFLFPAITKARELFAAGDTLRSTDHLRRVVDLPHNLDELSPTERSTIEKFLRWARSQDADESYIAQHRRSWWSVELRAPAPILCTYMARRAPAFVRNIAGARHLNIAHGLYPREHMSDSTLSAILAHLRRHTTTTGGRTYAGGLTKFEPREVERIRVPDVQRLYEYTKAIDDCRASLTADAAAEGISVPHGAAHLCRRSKNHCRFGTHADASARRR